MFLSNTKQMSTNQQDTLTESLIMILKKIINKIGNERLHDLLNDFLPTIQKQNNLNYSEKELFELVTLNLVNFDAETLEFKLKKRLNKILSEQQQLEDSDINILTKVFSQICEEFKVSPRILQPKIRGSKAEREVVCIFSFIAKNKYYYDSIKISRFLRISSRQVDRNITLIETLNPKFPKEKLLLEKLEQVKEKINTNLN